MRHSSEQANASVSNAQEAANALNGIGLRVNEITEMNTQIATAVEQQGAVSEDINRSINSIKVTANTSVRTVQKNYESAEAVNRLSAAMSELAQQFWEKRR